VSSTHPADAGVQSDLVETLLDFGAAINGLEDNESPLMTALAFGYLGAAETLARRAARIDTIISAAALGRSQLVAELLVDGTTLRPDVPLPAPRWLGVSANARAHIELGFVWACKFGHVEVVEIMLEKGVDPAAKDADDMTALHWASAGGHRDVVRRLLQRGAHLEATNTWGGTVLDSTVYFARHVQRGDVDYTAVIELLIAAGADVGAVTPFPTGDAVIDSLLRRR
jgi:ankyrin repeat protein